MLEQEIIEKFDKLDGETQQRIIIQLIGNMRKKPLDYKTWAEGVDEFREGLLTELGAGVLTGGLDLLEELREE